MLSHFFSSNQNRVIYTFTAIVAVIIALLYWKMNTGIASTDDAYVNANVVQIAPQINGRIVGLYVKNNDEVKKGQLLLQIDPNPFLNAVAESKAQLAIDEANLADTEMTAKRTAILVEKKFMSAQAGDDANAALDKAKAVISLDQAALASNELNLGYTKIVAPTNGKISNLSLRVGSTVNVNQPLFALVDTQTYWVDANYKETQLEKIKPGQSAIIILDMYPKHRFHGVVESVSPSSGTAFALLPPENATGNWVKVTQRIPVRVRITTLDNKRYPLPVGATATVKIHTHS